MKKETSTSGGTLQRVGTATTLLAVVAGGILALFYFWNQLLRPGDLNAISLPLVALVAGIAATFNPCSMPALPGFLAIGGGNSEGAGLGRRLGLSLAVALGALTIVIALGIIVAIVGSGTKALIAPYFRWIQLGVGLFLVAVALLHLAGQTHRLPLVGPVMGLGSKMWEGAMGNLTPRTSFLFGGGFVVVGVG